MTARVQYASEVTIARDGYTREGRLFLSSGGWWAQNDAPGYPGFDKSANTIAANTATLAALMEWLTGKTSGASALICAPDPVTSGYAFNTVWQAALVGLGHTFTLSGVANSFNGHDPNDFDCVHVYDSVAPPDAFGIAFDAYLDAKGAAFVLCQPGTHFSRYGVRARNSSPYYQTAAAAPDYLMTYPSLPIGGASYRVTQHTTSLLEAVAGTRGGTTTLYNNTYGEPGMATWVLA